MPVLHSAFGVVRLALIKIAALLSTVGNFIELLSRSNPPGGDLNLAIEFWVKSNVPVAHLIHYSIDLLRNTFHFTTGGLLGLPALATSGSA